ncbi:MAG: VOC family protein, partial [bacterium]
KPGRSGAGTVHHIAWRVADDAAQAEWMEEITKVGAHVTTVQDRTYFHSIYFREPGGVLFEIATDGPGWTVDELAESLGHKLALPAWLEGQRDAIAMRLAPFQTPDGVSLP